MAAKSVWTDGSCLGNGTPEAVSAFGVYYGHLDRRNYSSTFNTYKHTNNRAELAAVIYALVMDFNKHDLVIHTDSIYSIKCITEYSNKWKLSGWVTSKGSPVESIDMIKFVLQCISQRKAAGLCTSFLHIKGHSGNEGNSAADLLARTAAASRRHGGRTKLLGKCGIPL